MSAKLVVLISGNGTNLQAILNACGDGSLPASVVAVVSNQSEAYGLIRAQAAGVAAVAFPRADGESRSDYDSRLAAAVSGYAPDFVVLAGWMRILTANFLNHFPNRVINLHPALPGMFPGTHAIERAYEAWQKEARENNGMAKRETSNCMPPGMPRMMGSGQYPIEFLFTPGRVTTLHEAWMQTRTIYTDGRGHPDDLEAGIFGHSIGRWEGDALVIDTIGIKTITELETGMKHSDKLRVTERIFLAKDNPDQLVVEMTMEDPEALEAPFRRTHTYKRERDWALMEFICAENDRNPVGADGHTEFQ